MSLTMFPRARRLPVGSGVLARSIWPALRIAAAVTLVVVPFGYAITANHSDVLLGAGFGIAVGVGVGLRGGSLSGPWTGILIGSIVGVASALIAGLLPWDGWVFLVLPVLALAVGLIDGIGGSSLSGYRDVRREAFIVSVLLSLGLCPAVLASEPFPESVRDVLLMIPLPFVLMPWATLLVGLLCHRREGWRDARPPRLLFLGAVALPAVLIVLLALGVADEGAGIWDMAVLVPLALVVLPAAAFLLGRAAITWLRPRLQVYGQLADYLRVMWVPIGGFAVGYLTIIVLFAGFYGMLGRFDPAAFGGAGEGAGITEWLSFSFFTALGQDFITVVPASIGARVLVGAHLILSAGWAVVLFAAVMSSIGPKLNRIAQRLGGDGDD